MSVHTMMSQPAFSEYAVLNSRYAPAVANSAPSSSHSTPTTATATTSNLYSGHHQTHPHHPSHYPRSMDTIIPDGGYDLHADSDGSDASIPPAVQGSEALAQATKNLIGLDAQGATWTAAYNKMQQQRKPSLSYSPFTRPSPGSGLPTQPPHHHLSSKANTSNVYSPISHSPGLPGYHNFLPPLSVDQPRSYDRSQELYGNEQSPQLPSPHSAESMKRQRSSTNSQSSETNGPLVPKATLLTASQKKANHIQSEQKRRANIKRGYEALCETIPALREAIRAEEEAALAHNGSVKKRGRAPKGQGSEDGEKADGRAGPRSESVVLQKTIEHLRAQIEEREFLKERLVRAQSSLPHNHPLNNVNRANAPWEKQWHGGKGDGIDENEDSDEDQS